MASHIYHVIYFAMFLCYVPYLQTMECIENRVVYNHPKRTEDMAGDALNEIVGNPYSSPEHLFQQVYIVKNFAERYCGRKFSIRQLVLDANENLKIGSRGWEIPQNQLNAIINFVERNRIYFEFNKMCIEEAGDFDIENIDVYNRLYVDYYTLPFNYYDVHEVIDEVKQCRDIAQTVIDEVPPRVTLGVVCVICGQLLNYTPYGKVANIIAGAGASFILESVVNGCEKKQEKKQGNKANDIRKPQKEKHPADIRQLW